MKLFNLLIISVLLLCNSLFAYDFNVKDYEYLEANKTYYMQEAKKKYGHLDYNQTKSEYALKDINTSKLLNNKKFDEKTLQLLLPPEYMAEIAKIKKQGDDDNKKYMSVFWFFTTAMSEEGLSNFMAQGKKLQEKYPNFQYFAVLRGFPKGTNIVEYANKFKNKKGADGVKIKIHPILYKKLNIKKVPAFALAFCPRSHFSNKECEFQYLARGDIKMDDFFQMIGDSDARYKKFYFDLIEAR